MSDTMREDNFESSNAWMSRLAPRLALVLSVILLGSVIYKVFNLSIFGVAYQGASYLLLLIAIFLPLIFVFFRANNRKGSKNVPVYDWILAAIAFSIPFYLFLHAIDIQNLGWSSGTAPMAVQVICLIFLIPAFEATRRVGGLSLAIICLFFAAYPLFANYMPGPLAGMNFSFWRTVSLHVMGGDSMLGMVMQVVGNVVVGYLLFGVVFQATGGGKFFMDLALSILGKFRGGPAKVAVLASSFFGSISGSVVGNVLAIGVMTIPTMKKAGYPAYYAGAIEACASTGGTLMPPVMGSAAFFCAQLLGIPYYEVCLAAIIPSILYYTGLFIQADGYAAQHGLAGLPKESIPSFGETLKEGWIYCVAVAIMVSFIFLRQESTAPFYGAAALLALSMLKKGTRLTWSKFKDVIVDSGKSIAQICAILLGVGFIVGSLSITGVAYSFSYEVVMLAGNSLALLLILGAAASFILGMGMVSSACYLFLALILAPAIIKVGVYPLAAHMFVMYCGMISFITPPVALGSIAAAGVANASAMKVGLQSMRLGIAIYFVPFAFALNPALILHGSILSIVVAVIAALAGVIFIAGTIEGHIVGLGNMHPLWRVVFGIAGILLLCPAWQLIVSGAVLGIGLYIILRIINLQAGRQGYA